MLPPCGQIHELHLHWVLIQGKKSFQIFRLLKSLANFFEAPKSSSWNCSITGFICERDLEEFPAMYDSVFRSSYTLSSVCVLNRVWLCNPMDCSPPGSSVHGTFQARILEWVAISSSRGSSRPRDSSCVCCAPALADGFTFDSPLLPHSHSVSGVLGILPSIFPIHHFRSSPIAPTMGHGLFVLCLDFRKGCFWSVPHCHPELSKVVWSGDELPVGIWNHRNRWDGLGQQWEEAEILRSGSCQEQT